MEDMDMFVDLITNLFLTIALYELVPFILKYCIGKIYTEKQARKIAIINTIIVYFLITIFYIFVMEDSKVASPYPAMLWGTIAYYMLKNNKGLQDDNIQNNNDIAVKDMLKQTKNTNNDLKS